MITCLSGIHCMRPAKIAQSDQGLRCPLTESLDTVDFSKVNQRPVVESIAIILFMLQSFGDLKFIFFIYCKEVCFCFFFIQNFDNILSI